MKVYMSSNEKYPKSKATLSKIDDEDFFTLLS